MHITTGPCSIRPATGLICSRGHRIATHGYASGRITRIVKKAGAKRMIYEQFGS
jgi:hypothetical protein